jgi:hypothetical protein
MTSAVGDVSAKFKRPWRLHSQPATACILRDVLLTEDFDKFNVENQSSVRANDIAGTVRTVSEV